ncbi:MAG TPA: O-methyltransferase [Gemmatimonadales bacterium]|jgi:predicted O-methyltransferase YrrM
MDILAPEISAYLDALVPPRPQELQAMERQAASTHFPIIGPASGQLCYLVARMIGARRVFELGSGFGYSTAWFARAVRENGGGEVHHVVWDERLSRDARRHLTALRYDDLVHFHNSEAVETLRGMSGSFDLIFNDIDKSGYPGSLPVITSRLRPGGVLIVDNLLWSGKVLDQADRSAETQGVRELTRLIRESDQWIWSIVPIRDGVLVAYKV